MKFNVSGILGSDGSYEELDPRPRRGQKKCLNYLLIGGVSAVVATVVVVFLVTTNLTPISYSGENGNDSDVVILQVHPIILGAEAPATSTQIVPEEDIVIELDQGMLRGLKLKSRGGKEYLGFLGVPYAKAPLGELRFMPPVEAEPWEGTLNATTLFPECIQKDKYNPKLVVKGSEDCLHLFIYTPKKLEDLNRRRSRGRLPVMLYIHGGGPYGNASRYGADYFMDSNPEVIFITMHYRLGVLGNLNTNDSSSRGNQGLKDQVMALQWIKDNISKFGGDRRKITLFGNSYGAMEVATHLLSPMSKRMFHRAICQSGVSIMPGMVNLHPKETAIELGQKFNCSSNNSTELVECLRNVPAEQIILSSYLMSFITTIEPPQENGRTDETILPDHPFHLLEQGNVNSMPVIFGVNSGEWLFQSLAILISENQTEEINIDFDNFMIENLELDATANDPYYIVENLHEFYFEARNVSRATVRNLTNMGSDRQFTHPASVFATFQKQNNRRNNNVYLYYFNREVPKKYSAAMEEAYKPEEFLGASHADELQLLFPYDNYPYIPLDSEWANVSQTMVNLWASFALDGNPTGTTNEWLPIDPNQKPYQWFQIDDSPKMIDFLGERMNLWDSFNLTDLYLENEYK